MTDRFDPWQTRFMFMKHEVTGVKSAADHEVFHTTVIIGTRVLAPYPGNSRKNPHYWGRTIRLDMFCKWKNQVWGSYLCWLVQFDDEDVDYVPAEWVYARCDERIQEYFSFSEDAYVNNFTDCYDRGAYVFF
jgi:hypothetical protein